MAVASSAPVEQMTPVPPVLVSCSTQDFPMGPGVAQTLTSMIAPPSQRAGLSRITWHTTLER